MRSKCDTAEEMLANCIEGNRTVQTGFVMGKFGTNRQMSVFHQIEKMHSQIWRTHHGRSLESK